jgi:hypothetical protein
MQQDHIRPSAIAPLAVIGRGHHFGDNAGIGRKRGTRHGNDFRRTPVADKAILRIGHRKDSTKAKRVAFGAWKRPRSHFAPKHDAVSQGLDPVGQRPD